MARDIDKLIEEEIKKRHLAQSSNGGKATFKKHGTDFFSEISRKGVAARRKLSTKKRTKRLAK